MQQHWYWGQTEIITWCG